MRASSPFRRASDARACGAGRSGRSPGPCGRSP
jgi:hypothetical protein